MDLEEYRKQVEDRFAVLYPGRTCWMPDFALRGHLNAGSDIETAVNDALWWSDRTEEGLNAA